MPFSPLESSLFDTLAGLPIHPLVVHLAVVLLPLAAMGLLAILAVRGWRERFGLLVLVGLAVGTGAAFVAKESGEALAERVGEPADHARWGDVLPVVAVGLFVVAVVWYFVQRRADKAVPPRRSIFGLVSGLVSALAALATIALTVLVGHSGAVAVWADTINAASASPSPAASPSGSESASATPSTTSSPSASSTAAAYTLAQVRQHNRESDCWAAVDQKVYNLTPWIAQHPGGQQVIVNLCGTDATAAFRNEHGQEGEPNQRLAEFLIGVLIA